MKNTVFSGPDIGILNCPTSTPVSNTAVTLPIEKDRYFIFPIKNPVPTVRNNATAGYCLSMSISASILF